MSREQRPFSPSLTTPVGGSIPEVAWPLSGFGTCPHKPAVMAKELPSPCDCPSLARGWVRALTTKVFGMKLSWLFPGSQDPPAPAHALPAPSSLPAWICWSFPVPKIGREILDRSPATSQEFLLPLGPLRCGHTQLLMVEVPHQADLHAAVPGWLLA